MSNTAQGLAGRRIESMLDEGSFVEIGGLVTARNTDFNLQQNETPADGVITGYGVIEGSLVYVYSQDASVLKGTIGEMHAKKITNIYDLAMKMGAPVIGLIDCAGIRLQEATDALNAFGEIYSRQAMASGLIPQISAVFGTCGGGLAVVPALSDFAFMEESKARLFVNTPNAIPDNDAKKCDNASAKFQSEESGLVHFIGDEGTVLSQVRQLITLLPANNEDDMSYDECRDDLNRLCEGIESISGDSAAAFAMLSDNRFFYELKSAYAREMVTGFIRLNGATVGAVANRTMICDEEGNVKETFEAALTSRGCNKAAEFVNFCDSFNIPVLTLTNVQGYQSSVCTERNIARAVGRLTYAFANATVPKVNVMIGSAFGSAYIAMNSKSIGADQVFAWPSAQIGMMDAKLAAKIMYPEGDAAVIIEKAEQYAEIQSSALSAARRGYVDNIIEAEETRKYVIGAFEMLFTKREDRPGKKHGTV